jgi:apolipoprotein N-acyltransferase
MNSRLKAFKVSEVLFRLSFVCCSILLIYHELFDRDPEGGFLLQVTYFVILLPLTLYRMTRGKSLIMNQLLCILLAFFGIAFLWVQKEQKLIVYLTIVFVILPSLACFALSTRKQIL